MENCKVEAMDEGSEEAAPAQEVAVEVVEERNSRILDGFLAFQGIKNVLTSILYNVADNLMNVEGRRLTQETLLEGFVKAFNEASNREAQEDGKSPRESLLDDAARLSKMFVNTDEARVQINKLRLHSDDETKSRNDNYCALCDYTARSRNNYNTHIQKSHVGLAKRYRCPVVNCKRHFDARWRVTTHLRTGHHLLKDSLKLKEGEHCSPYKKYAKEAVEISINIQDFIGSKNLVTQDIRYKTLQGRKRKAQTPSSDDTRDGPSDGSSTDVSEYHEMEQEQVERPAASGSRGRNGRGRGGNGRGKSGNAIMKSIKYR
ncbi:unnamed protein product [Allacma fusca]|uniref:C2H2-type domain-containing protein n=1 Tax=Allacma fusca TaxID=39272 RepID=A0A8J2PD76_9HEXA|nr:unnamed protein product [Allacma fusca]